MDDVLIPKELVIIEISRWLDFKTILSLSMVCSEIHRVWKTMVRKLPLVLVWRCDDQKLSTFTAFATLYLGGNQNITNLGLAPLTALTTLDLGENQNITDLGLAPLTALTTLDLGANQNITDKRFIKM